MIDDIARVTVWSETLRKIVVDTLGHDLYTYTPVQRGWKPQRGGWGGGRGQTFCDDLVNRMLTGQWRCGMIQFVDVALPVGSGRGGREKDVDRLGRG